MTGESVGDRASTACVPAEDHVEPVLAAVRDAASHLPDDQASFIAKQITLFEQQRRCLQDAIQTHRTITTKNPISNQDLAAQSPEPSTQPDGTTHLTTDSVPKASGPPPPEWQELAVSLFSIADTLTPIQLRSLAHILGCSEEIIGHDYNKQRTSVRNFLQRVQKKAAHTQVQQQQQQQAADPPQNPSALDDPATQAAELQELGLQRLLAMQDEEGAITVPSSADKIIMQMQGASSYGLRTAQLAVVAATTSRAVLMRFTTSRFLDVMAGWLRAAELDGQSTFLMQVVRVLAHVPLSLAVPRDALQSAIKRLLHYKSARVVAAAALLLQLWQAQEAGGGPPVDTLRAKLMAHTKVAQESCLPPAPAPQQQQPEGGEQPEQAQGALGMQALSSRPHSSSGHKRDTSQRPLLSTDDIIREKKRFALLGKQWPGQKPHGAPEPSNRQHANGGTLGASKVVLPLPPDRGAAAASRDRNRPAPPRPNPGYEHYLDAGLLPSSMQPQAHQPSQPLHSEQQAAVQAQRRRHQQWAARRQQYLTRETDRQLETLARLASMAPSVTWHAPPHIPPPEPSAPPAQGEDSHERQVQRNREGTVSRVVYGPKDRRPVTPMEPANAAYDPSDGRSPVIPFTPVDPLEERAQNAALWGRGVRLPAFVSPPDPAADAKAAAAAAQAAAVAAAQAAAPHAMYNQQLAAAGYSHAAQQLQPQHQQYLPQQYQQQYGTQVQYMQQPAQQQQQQQQQAYGYYQLQQPGAQQLQQQHAYQVQVPGGYVTGQQSQQLQQQQHLGYYPTGA